MRVLVVEDDGETAEYICTSLKALGHVTKHASDGKQGFLDALDNDFDVIVVDRMLPGRDGLSLIKSVRQSGLQTPILILGGILAGIYKPEVQAPQSRWESNQGGFIAVFDVACFMPVDEFKKEMDRYVREARSMAPLPGQEQAELAGTVEWQRERDWARDGVPLSPKHQLKYR